MRNNNLSTNNIFISYRVHDTAGTTGRLVDSLRQHFAEEQIFIDIDKIDPGSDFTKVISTSLESCQVMLAIIGPEWTGSSNGKSRIKDPKDWVRIEISTALQRNIRVVPILVDGAKLPEPDELPEDLQPLVYRQTYEITNKRWKYDTDQLIEFLIVTAGIKPLVDIRRKIVTPSKPFWSTNSVWIVALIGVIAFGIIFRSLFEHKSDPNPPVKTDTLSRGGNNPLPIYDSPKPSPKPVDPKPEPEPVRNVENIAGTWDETRGIFFMRIAQQNNKLSIQSFAANGMQTGQGTGFIDGNDIKVSITLYTGGFTDIEAILAKDGYSFSGKAITTINGATVSEPFAMEKRIAD